VTARTYRPAEVSKERLDRDLPDQQTVSFRAGELALPPRLIEALEATGYRYDSSIRPACAPIPDAGSSSVRTLQRAAAGGRRVPVSFRYR
jgi:hypothetical protein